ncbi:MAG: AAA family ATPase [Spirochaetota bacterium]
MIPYDRMKEQLDKELSPCIQASASGLCELPRITYEKGITQISFPLVHFSEASFFAILTILKNHIENVRIHAFGDGYYAFQALNSSIFNTDNILDNIKVEVLGLTSSSRCEVSKKGNLSQEEINTVVELFKYACGSDAEDPESALKKLGATVYTDHGILDWNYIAGYDEVKRKIRESVIMPLQNPEIYDSIVRLTRRTVESNRPNAILFEGAPGVGKTTIARIIANEVSIPLVYVPVESIMSKWYGQSSQNLSSIFDYTEFLGNSILFLDEIDSLAGSRDQNMFEATRRILSVLLRRLDGIDAVSNTITIGATNRKNDLDPALLSRFDQSIHFPLPNQNERAAIFANYARHLTSEETKLLGTLSDGLSGRSIKDVCEYTERRWARKLIIQKSDISAPPAEYYKYSTGLWIDDNNG